MAAQVQRAEKSMAEIKLQSLWVEGELKERALAVQAHQVEGGMSQLAAVQEKVEVRIEDMKGDLSDLRALVLHLLAADQAVANGSSDSDSEAT